MTPGLLLAKRSVRGGKGRADGGSSSGRQAAAAAAFSERRLEQSAAELWRKFAVLSRPTDAARSRRVKSDSAASACGG